jgi:N-acetyl-gamma-glutamyl-phosphate reductase
MAHVLNLKTMLNIAIIGVTGYAGEELIRVLLKHPKVQIVSVSAKIDKPCKIEELYPDLKGKIDLVCTEPDIDEIIKTADCIFLALPHTVSMSMVPKFVNKGKVVIDLSADYRLGIQVYEQHYKCKHTDAQNLKMAVYGLPEANRDFIKKAKLIANPGCYPTAALLALLPLLKQKVKLESIYIDAKSGTSGAGRNPNLKMEEFISKHNLKAYKINCHQHAPEIQAQIEKFSGQNPEFVFVPHLMPFERGILETIYIRSQFTDHSSQIIEMYKEFYKNEPFVRVLDEGKFPELINVVGTNFCEIGLKIEDNLIIIVSAIDNLLKGASGQAVENMNIIYQFEETLGLT